MQYGGKHREIMHYRCEIMQYEMGELWRCLAAPWYARGHVLNGIMIRKSLIFVSVRHDLNLHPNLMSVRFVFIISDRIANSITFDSFEMKLSCWFECECQKQGGFMKKSPCLRMNVKHVIIIMRSHSTFKCKPRTPEILSWLTVALAMTMHRTCCMRSHRHYSFESLFLMWHITAQMQFNCEVARCLPRTDCWLTVCFADEILSECPAVFVVKFLWRRAGYQANEYCFGSLAFEKRLAGPALIKELIDI